MIRILANPFILTFIFFEGCGIYSFTGASIPAGANTFQVDYFENQAGSRPGSIVEPGLDTGHHFRTDQFKPGEFWRRFNL